MQTLDVNDASSSRSCKNLFENDSENGLDEFQANQAHLELQDNLSAQVNMLQEKLKMLHNSNNSRSDLIQVLDKRDAHLQSEHLQLQEKLAELQNKKRQVDRLVSQLQNMDDEVVEDDDIGEWDKFLKLLRILRFKKFLKLKILMLHLINSL